MMTFSIDLADGAVVPTLLYTITRIDGTIERITPHAQDITISAVTWTSMGGLQAGVLSQRNDGTPPAMGLNVTLTSAGKLKFRDVVRGKYEGATVLVQICDAAAPATPDFIASLMMLGQIQYSVAGQAKFDLISKYAVPRDILVTVFQLQCEYSFGDPLTCKIPTFPYTLGGDLNDVKRSETIAVGYRRRFKFASAGDPTDYDNVYLECTAITTGITSGSAPTISSTVGATSTDGGVTWTTRNSYVRAVRISATDGLRTLTLDRLVDPRASDSTWLQPFKIKFWDGEYAGRTFPGSAYDSGANTVQVYLPCPFAAVNDWAEIAPECDHTYPTCNTKFANAANHGGYPFQLGAKAQAQALALT